MPEPTQYADPNFVTARHPMARCVPETFKGGWMPGVVRNYVIVPNPQSKEILGKGPTVSLAWESAANNLRGIKPVEAPINKEVLAGVASTGFKVPGYKPPVIAKEKKVKKEWNSKQEFMTWATFHWGTSSDSLFMKADPQFPDRYLQSVVQAAWEGWAACEEIKKKYKK